MPEIPQALNEEDLDTFLAEVDLVHEKVFFLL
jgi:hypothetical protein